METEHTVAVTPPRWDPIPYELRIGVTGHRTLANAVEVEAAVRVLLEQVVDTLRGASADPLGPHGSPQSRADRLDRVLGSILSRLTRLVAPPLNLVARVISTHWRSPRVPTSTARPSPAQQTPLKLTVISCLAKGADQIVARVVCDMVTDKDERNRYLEAVLPFPQDIYARDNDPAAFSALLALDCGRLNTQPSPTVLYPDFVADGNGSGQVSREDAYAVAGRYMVSTSEMVLAVWDPRRDWHPGGTADTVRYAIAQGRTVLWIDPAHLDNGPALLRFEPGIGQEGQPPIPSGSVCFTSGAHRFRAEPVPTRARMLSRNFHRLAAYNRDSAIDLQDLQAEWSRRAGELRPSFEQHGLPETVTSTVVDVLLPLHVRADCLAARYRALRDFSAKLWPTAAAVVVSVMAFQVVFLPEHYWLAIVELAVLVLGYVSYRVSLYDAWHAKWLNDRRVAEGLRGAMFSVLLPREEAALLARSRHAQPPCASAHTQNPLPFYSPATAWFVDSLKRAMAKHRRRFAADLTLQDETQRRDIADVLRLAWIRAQRTHHEKRAIGQARIATRGRRVRLAMIVALALIAVLHALGTGHASGPTASPLSRFDLWVGFATVALPAWTAAFHVMLSLDDHERLGERSAHMARLLEGLEEELEHVDTVGDLRATIAEAERIMDLESAEWAESLMDRKPEFTG